MAKNASMCDGTPRPATAAAAFRLLWLGQFLTTAGLTVVVPFAPLYLTQLGALDTQENALWTGLALAAPAPLLFAMGPVWGRCGDRFGRKWMVLRALAGIALSLLMMGLAQTPAQFVAARLLQGAFGGVDDAAAAFVGGDRTRARAFGGLQGALAAGALVGPAVAAVAAPALGFRALLIGLGSVVALVALAAARYVREPARVEADITDARCSLPALVASLLRQRRSRAFISAGIVVQAAMFALLAIYAPYVAHLDAAHATRWVGLLQSLFWLGAMAGAPWWGRRGERVAPETLFVWAGGGAALALLAQAVVTDPAWLAPWRLLQGFCYSAFLPALLLAVAQDAGGAHRGAAIGAVSSLLVIGHVLGAMLGAVAGSLLPLPAAIGFMALLHLGAAGLLRRHRCPARTQKEALSWRRY